MRSTIESRLQPCHPPSDGTALWKPQSRSLRLQHLKLDIFKKPRVLFPKQRSVRFRFGTLAMPSQRLSLEDLNFHKCRSTNPAPVTFQPPAFQRNRFSKLLWSQTPMPTRASHPRHHRAENMSTAKPAPPRIGYSQGMPKSGLSFARRLFGHRHRLRETRATKGHQIAFIKFEPVDLRTIWSRMFSGRFWAWEGSEF